jgi:hypothetical protein
MVVRADHAPGENQGEGTDRRRRRDSNSLITASTPTHGHSPWLFFSPEAGGIETFIPFTR